MSESLRIFIGSGEASLLERKVLIWSLRQHASMPLDIRVFNGTHNALEVEGQAPQALDFPLALKYRNRATEFSLYRFLIPQLCDYRGLALWLDSDIVCLDDVAKLFAMPMQDYAMLARADAYPGQGAQQWGMSVVLMDCARCRFDLPRYYTEMDAGAYTYDNFSRMSPAFLSRHPFALGALDRRWNEFDLARPDTALLHYTELTTQPWKFPGHPCGEIWYRYYRGARQTGFLTDAEVQLTRLRGFARQDVELGNSSWASLWRQFRRAVRLSIGRYPWHHQ
jgi:lipopolysaccharide biosynthesis glycosyltransferase